MIDCYPAGVSNKHCLLSLFSLYMSFKDKALLKYYHDILDFRI